MVQTDWGDWLLTKNDSDRQILLLGSDSSLDKTLSSCARLSSNVDSIVILLPSTSADVMLAYFLEGRW